MADTGHMHTNLMCSACLKAALNIGVFAKSLKYTVVRHCMSAVLMVNAHFLPIGIHTANRCINGSLIFFDIIINNRIIGPCNTVHAELFCNGAMRPVIFADNKHTCCILINSMHYSGP